MLFLTVQAVAAARPIPGRRAERLSPLVLNRGPHGPAPCILWHGPLRGHRLLPSDLTSPRTDTITPLRLRCSAGNCDPAVFCCSQKASEIADFEYEIGRGPGI